MAHQTHHDNNNAHQQQQQQQHQQQEFVAPSLCIPRTHSNIRRERLFAVMRSLGLGWIGRIDIVEKKDEQTGAPFIRVFIHFTRWFKNKHTEQFLRHLETHKSANIVYDEPWFWKVTKSFVPPPIEPPQQQQQQQKYSGFPRPRIDLTTTTATTKQQPKTPAAADASGKGVGNKTDAIVPVQVKRNASDDAHSSSSSSSDYWTTIAEAATTAAAVRLSVSVSPPSKVERKLFSDEASSAAVSLNKST